MRSLTTRPPPSPSSTTTLSSWFSSSSPPSSCSRTSTPPCILYNELYMSHTLTTFGIYQVRGDTPCRNESHTKVVVRSRSQQEDSKIGKKCWKKVWGPKLHPDRRSIWNLYLNGMSTGRNRFEFVWASKFDPDAFNEIAFSALQILVFSLTCLFPVTTFCPSVPPQDSSLCCPQAPSKGGRTEGTRGWDWVRSGSQMALHYIVFHLNWGWG